MDKWVIAAALSGACAVTAIVLFGVWLDRNVVRGDEWASLSCGDITLVRHYGGDMSITIRGSEDE